MCQNVNINWRIHLKRPLEKLFRVTEDRDSKFEIDYQIHICNTFDICQAEKAGKE